MVVKLFHIPVNLGDFHPEPPTDFSEEPSAQSDPQGAASFHGFVPETSLFRAPRLDEGLSDTAIKPV